MLLIRKVGRPGISAGRNGRVLENVGDVNGYSNLNLSPDDERIVFTDEDPDWTTSVWVMKLRERRISRITNLSGASFHGFWSPNGRDVMFANGNEQRIRLLQQSVNSAIPVTVLDTPGAKLLTGWSNDGRFVAYLTSWPDFGHLTTIVSDLEHPSSHPLYETRYSQTEVTFAQNKPSPRWIAYSSNETSQREIYVRSFPDLRRVKRRWMAAVLESDRTGIVLSFARRDSYGHLD